MSDSEDDFVEVNGYHSSSDSDSWEKISGYSSSEEEVEELDEVTNTNSKKHEWPSQQMVSSYYQSPSTLQLSHLHEQIAHNTVQTSKDDLALAQQLQNEEREKLRCHSTGSRPESKRAKGKERKKQHWDKVTLKRGQGAPYDPVEFLGITGGEKALLSHFSITTIGQLAYFNVMDFVSSTHPEKFAVILDLQERAYQAVTEYVTKASTQPDTVWGYLYLGDKAMKNILRKGYLDSDSLFFLWTPMPAVMYRDQLAIDDLVGMETKDRDLRSRYSRFIKINLTKLSNKYYGRLYQRDPNNATTGNKWINLSLMEAAELAQREDLWFAFEPGNDIYSRVTHGSIVIPTGRIPQDCVEMDKETAVFAKVSKKGKGAKSAEENFESSDEDEHREEPNPTVAAQLEFFY